MLCLSKPLTILLAVVLIGTAQANADEAYEFIRQGFQAQQGNDQTRAVDLFLRGLQLHPEPVTEGKARFYLAKAYEALGQKQNALDNYRAVQRLAPDSVEDFQAAAGQLKIEQALQSRLQSAADTPGFSARVDLLSQVAADFPSEPGPTAAHHQAEKRYSEARQRLSEIMLIADPNQRLIRLTSSPTADPFDWDATTLPEAEQARNEARQAIASARPVPSALPVPVPLGSASRFGEVLNRISGRWTTGDPSQCQTHFYTWSYAGDQMTFVDERGQVDSELVTDFDDGVLHSTTLASRHADNQSEVVGTRWEYQFQSRDRVQARNLDTRSSFLLKLCL